MPTSTCTHRLSPELASHTNLLQEGYKLIGVTSIERGQHSQSVLIHFDAEFVDKLLCSGDARAEASVSHVTDSIACYCLWASGCMGRVEVLVPEVVRDRWHSMMPSTTAIRPIWYADQTSASQLVQITAGQTWLIRGSLFPILNWHLAFELRQQHLSDILIYCRTDDRELAPTYPEYVRLGASGNVVAVERHYGDSPRFQREETGPIVLVATGGTQTLQLVDHVLEHGWDTERFEPLADRLLADWVATPAMSIAPETSEPVHMVTGHSIRHSTSGALNLSPLREVSQHVPSSKTTSPGRWTNPDSTTIPELAVPRGFGVLEESSPTGANGHRHGKTTTLSFPLPDQSPTSARLLPRPSPWRSVAFEVSKRFLDLSVSVTLLIALSPLLLAIALWVKLTSSGPIFYQDTRQTKDGKEFECLKFRTMVANASQMQQSLRDKNEVDGPQFKLSQDPRLTSIGHLLRRYNLDELPQLINVVVGDMSLVGPRPSPDSENQLCPGWRRTRLSVKSGVTGLWQVLRLRGDGQSDFQEWIYYDVEYATHRSLWLDLQILLYTPFTVFAPYVLNGFAERLARRGICTQSARLRDSLHPLNHRE